MSDLLPFHKIFKQPRTLVFSNTLHSLWFTRMKKWNIESKSSQMILCSFCHQQTTSRTSYWTRDSKTAWNKKFRNDLVEQRKQWWRNWSYGKTKETEFNSSDEEKFLRRRNQSRVPTYICIGCWLYKAAGQGNKDDAEVPAAGSGVCRCDMLGEWVPF